MPTPSASAPRVGPLETPPLAENSYQFMVGDAHLAMVREMRRERRARLAAVRTRRQAAAYQERAAAAIARAFAPVAGPRPPARTPLDARVTGVIERADHRVEKIVFASRPGCLVSANLYLPNGAGTTQPHPAVIADCGHAQNGKAYHRYQEFPQRLAAAGFVVLLIDPFCQGERDQYARLPQALRVGISDDCCSAHNLIGLQLELVGEFFGAWRAWDGMRGIDYLLSRPEVDPRHLGVTGNSGGGTTTMALWGCDRRLTMAAPSCAVASFGANLENQLPCDSEQYLPGILAAGLEMADLFIARAPEPSLLLAQSHDFFDRRAAREAHEEIRRFHDLLGAPRRSHGLLIDELGHDLSRRHQEALVDFFHRHARGKPTPRGAVRETCPIAPDAELQATAEGSVILAGGAPVYELIAERARAVAGSRRRIAASALPRLVAETLGLSAAESRPGPAPHYRVLRPRWYEGFHATRYAVETEGESIRAFLYRPRPAHLDSLDVEPRLTLYLPHLASEIEMTDPALTGALAERGPLYLLDARGLGESRPPGDFFHRYGYDYMNHGHELMLGRGLLGRRVLDALRTIDLLVAGGARRIDLVGRGQGAILALYAAVLRRDRVASVELRNGPLSYLEWATSPVVRWPVANVPRGVLARFDIPDLVRFLGRKVSVVEPWDALMQPPAAVASSG